MCVERRDSSPWSCPGSTCWRASLGWFVLVALVPVSARRLCWLSSGSPGGSAGVTAWSLSSPLLLLHCSSLAVVTSGYISVASPEAEPESSPLLDVVCLARLRRARVRVLLLSIRPAQGESGAASLAVLGVSVVASASGKCLVCPEPSTLQYTTLSRTMSQVRVHPVGSMAVRGKSSCCLVAHSCNVLGRPSC